MRLIRMRLDNWRGVRSREMRFADGVTVVEGPNEIGKSTIVEALAALLDTLDSSNARSIRAVQPVGEDVGSRVEVELRAGPYHIVYAKTFNKGRKTTLEVLAPDKRQLTGREAHEAVERMLAETVDMPLFKALMLVQGEKVAPAKLQHSSSLAAALDEAAGRAAGGTEGTGIDGGDHDSLFDAVRTEYERYFTPKTGKPRYDDVDKAHARAAEALDAARKALEEVAHNADRRERQDAEVRRLAAAVPSLVSQVEVLERDWQSARELEARLEARVAEHARALAARDEADAARRTRREQVAELADWQKRLADAADGLTPLEADTAVAAERLAATRTAAAGHEADEKRLRRSLALARADLDHLGRLERLAGERQRLERLDRIAGDLRVHLDAVAAGRVTDEALERYRTATRDLEVARSKRDLAATVVALTALRPLTVDIEGEAVELAPDAPLRRTVSSALELTVPDALAVRIEPPQSAADLDRELADAMEAMAELVRQYGAATLDDAVKAHATRASAQASIKRLEDQERAVLDGADRRTIEQRVAELAGACTDYAQRRDSETDLPGSVAAADTHLAGVTARHDAAEATLDQARQRLERDDREHAALDAKLREAQQSLAGLDAGRGAAEAALKRARNGMADDDLDARVAKAAAALASIEGALTDLRERVERAAPDIARTRLDNARAVLERARTEHEQARTELAVIGDRLSQAQADGRYEVVDAAERAETEALAERDAVHRRAAAARLLWQTLSTRRDAARAAYVEPLKRAIERLGAYVYGSGFEIELGEDWTIVARTLDGKTLAYDSLSVGAQEQLSLLARLAAAQIVSDEGGVPLIIDDALGFSDPARLQSMGTAMAAAGKTSQVIVLTCTPGRFMHVGSAEVLRLGDDG